MTSTSLLRARLLLALGLPACGPSVSGPVPPPGESHLTHPTQPTRPTQPTGSLTCGVDQVLESVCGRVTVEHDTAKAGAPAPHDNCPASAVDLDSFDDNDVMDGWRHNEHDAVYANMTYSSARTAAFSLTSGVAEGEPRCCYERCTALPAIPKARAALPAGMHEFEDCLPKPVSASHPAAVAPGCPIAMHMRLWYPYGNVDPFDDAPFARADDNTCCYMVATTHKCPPNTFEEGNECKEPNPGGRPLREDGVAVVAPARARDGWVTPVAIEGLSPAARAFAASAWAREAAFEHASIAAFARVAVELMAHGAPADLVDAALAAARDEVRHARRCYGLAAALGGAGGVGPGPLPVATSTRIPTLEELAVDCFRDGCVNETVAALCVAEAARRADPSLHDTLAAIADDEARHAELSYRILAWALREGGAPIRARIATELAGVAPEAPSEAHADHDERAGILHPRTAADVRRRVIADVVVPCTEALLASSLG